MKIALAQINPIVGDIEYNFNLILENVQRARKEKAELLVLPELSLLGYPPKDLLLKPSLCEKQDYFLKELALYTDDDFAILVGAATANEGFGKKLLNSLIMLYQGKEYAVGSKTLLPNYDVFDETRYFEPVKEPTVVEYKGIRFGLSICEDIWIEAYPSMYTRDPIAEMIANGADIIINAAASPYVTDKPKRREKLLANAAKRYKKPIIYVNQIGANDQLIFDGSSLIINSRGDLIKELDKFAPDFTVIDSYELKAPEKFTTTSPSFESTELQPSIEELELTDLASIEKAIVLGIKDYSRKCGFTDVILGISGGIDSALVATLAVEALGPEHVYLVSMPSVHTSRQSIDDAVTLARNLGILTADQDPQKTKITDGANFEIVPIDGLHDSVQKLMPQIKDKADENLQARLRANILMAFANTMGAMLLNTGNKSEVAVGYCTMYGDSCGALAVISDLLKTTVYKLSAFINKESTKELIPQSIIDRAPTAELSPGQLDQDSLPPYDVLDKIVLLYIQEMKSIAEIVKEGVDEATAMRIMNMIDKAEYKRHQMPPGIKIAGKAFGLGRRMPIAQGFKHK